MNIAERLKNNGIQQGIQQGEQTLLLRQLERKFHHIPEVYRQKLAQAGSEDLLMWGERIIEASSLDSIFKN